MFDIQLIRKTHEKSSSEKKWKAEIKPTPHWLNVEGQHHFQLKNEPKQKQSPGQTDRQTVVEESGPGKRNDSNKWEIFHEKQIYAQFFYEFSLFMAKDIDKGDRPGRREGDGGWKIANKTNHLTGVLWNGTWHLFLCLRDICYVFVESFKSNQSHNDKVKLTFIRFLSIMESIILSSKFYSAQNKK